MISYAPFWKTIEAKGISTYYLINAKRLSSSLLDKLRHGKGITTTSINEICKALSCNVQDIMQYIPDDK